MRSMPRPPHPYSWGSLEHWLPSCRSYVQYEHSEWFFRRQDVFTAPFEHQEVYVLHLGPIFTKCEKMNVCLCCGVWRRENIFGGRNLPQMMFAPILMHLRSHLPQRSRSYTHLRLLWVVTFRLCENPRNRSFDETQDIPLLIGAMYGPLSGSKLNSCE